MITGSTAARKPLQKISMKLRNIPATACIVSNLDMKPYFFALKCLKRLVIPHTILTIPRIIQINPVENSGFTVSIIPIIILAIVSGSKER